MILSQRQPGFKEDFGDIVRTETILDEELLIEVVFGEKQAGVVLTDKRSGAEYVLPPFVFMRLMMSLMGVLPMLTNA